MNLIENSIPSKKKIENSNTKKNLRYCYFIPSKCTFSPDDSQVHSHMTETFTKFTHSSRTNNYQVPLAFKTLSLSLSLSLNHKVAISMRKSQRMGRKERKLVETISIIDVDSPSPTSGMFFSTVWSFSFLVLLLFL